MATTVGLGERYDCGFNDASGNFIGLKLLRDRKGVPFYVENNDPGVSNQIYSGVPGYAMLRPQYELQIGQDDWLAGFGLEYQDTDHPKRFYYSANVDTRFKGRVLGTPNIQTQTLPTLLSITDGGVETWTDANNLTNWTEVNGTVAREAATKYAGTYSAYLQSDAGAPGCDITQALTGWTTPTDDATWRGVYMVASAYMWCAQADTGCLIWTDVDGSTESSTVAGDSAWHEVIVARTVGSNATSLTVKARAKNQAPNPNVYVDAITVPTSGAVGNFCEFNDHLYFSDGGYVMKINSSTGALTIVAGFPWTITDMAAAYDDRMYIAFGTSHTCYYMNTSDAFTATDTSANQFVLSGDNFYKAILPNEIYIADDSAGDDPATNANWSTAFYVGKVTDNITWLEEIAGEPIVCKEDFPYKMDSSPTAAVATALMPSLISEKSSTSGENSLVWQGRLYVPCGNQSLYEYDDGVITDISPGKFITNSTIFDGQVQALAADAQYLYAIVDNATSIEILCGRWETIDDDLEWRWHPWFSGTFEINEAHCSAVYARRIWLGATTSSLKWLPIPNLYGNIENDTTYAAGGFVTGGYLVTPWMHADLQGDDKAFNLLTCRSVQLSATIYWTVSYQRQGDGSTWYTVGSTGKYTTSPTQTNYLYNSGASTVYPETNMIRFKFVSTTTGTGITSHPILLGWDSRAVWYPAHKKIIKMKVVVSKDTYLNYGQVDEVQSLGAVRTALEAWNNPATHWPRAFYPPYYESDSDIIYCKLLPTDSEDYCSLVVNESTGNLEWVYNLKLMKVTLS